MFGFWQKKRRKDHSFTITVNDPVANAEHGYPSNEVRTTKYTLLSFVPKNFVEQFRRYQNFYFLLVCIPACIPSISPISPASALVPFFFILLVSAAKEAFEDVKRWQSDNEFNGRKYEVYQDKLWVSVSAQSIQVGDIIALKEGEEVPADTVLLSTNNDDGVCYYETANLDGETYLKQGKSLAITTGWTRPKFASLSAFLSVEPPHKTLYQLTGTFTMAPEGSVLGNPLNRGEKHEDVVVSLNNPQLLMRGVKMRNTKESFGVVTYTGPNTKLALNQVEVPSKFSQTEKFTNWVTIVIFILKICLVIACTISTAALSGGDIWYLESHTSVSYEAGVTFASYFVLFAYFIPISLFVNLEVIKLAQAAFMMADNDMKVDGQGMTVRNSNLNDELSKVGYIFSDKTGTLTQNKMVFHGCSINRQNYKDAGMGTLQSLVCGDPYVADFFVNLACNNEVLPEDTGASMPHYAAPSPDEVAMARGAFVNGVKLLSRSKGGIMIQIGDGQPQLYEILSILPFSSERKRSSVIVKGPNGRIILYAKGADQVILERLNAKIHDSPIIKDTKKHLTNYSTKGLRTLVIARKELSLQEYQAWKQQFDQADLAMVNRKQQTEAVMDKIEQGMTIQGCTAIEDKLQDQVPWTINYCIRCGIKVWMITGDSLETAENIGRSCKLIGEDSALIKVVAATSSEECGQMMDTAQRVVKSESKVTLIVDSKSLGFILVDYSDVFANVSLECASVIVCRAEPLQKAQVVSLIKRSLPNEITLAIGDGANDVPMIQEAHIGVGIHGQEGTQAARSSDYALREFKHLAKLVTVHGRYNMMRTALMVEYSFYKNLAMFIVQFWFAFYCHFSAQTFYDSWLMAGFNTILISAPPLALALFEKDLREDVLFQYPEAYPELKKGLYLTPYTFSRWMLAAVYHSVVFWFSFFVLPNPLRENSDYYGQPSLNEQSTFIAIAAMWVIILKAALVTRNWVWVNHFAYWGSMILILLFLLVESSLLTLLPSFYKTMQFVLSAPSFYFYVPCLIMVCLIPEFAYEFIQSQYFPYRWQRIREATQHIKPRDTASVQQLGYAERVEEPDDHDNFVPLVALSPEPSENVSLRVSISESNTD